MIRTNKMTPIKEVTPKLQSKRLEAITTIERNIKTTTIRVTRNRKVISKKITKLPKEDSRTTIIVAILAITRSKPRNKRHHNNLVARDNKTKITTMAMEVVAITKDLQTKKIIEEIITKIVEALLLPQVMLTKQIPTKRPSKLQVFHR